MIRAVGRLIPKGARHALIAWLKNLLQVHDGGPATYAQCGEDRILVFLFNSLGIKEPIYLEVGTCHPCKGNNTYLFYQRGGHGVCVEPNPDLVPLIRQTRPRDVVLGVGVTPEPSASLTYYMFDEPSLNTFDAGEAQQRKSSGLNPIKSELTIPTVTLNSILKEHFTGGLDLLSLDVEGLDLALLQSLDFSITRPLSICVESVGYSEHLLKPKINEVEEVMSAAGYVKFADTYINTIFVDQKSLSQFDH